MSLRLAVCAVALVVATAARGQSASPTMRQMYHTSWTTRDGAPATITQIVQAPDGFLWLGTTTGLYRFDGVRFERFEPAPGPQLLSRSITALGVLPNGDIWVGYTFGGASHIVGRRVTNYGESDGLPRGQVAAFALDSSGTVWAATSTGIARLAGGRWSPLGPSYAIRDSNATALLVDRHATLWVASLGGVYALPRGARTFVRRAPTLGIGNSGALAEGPDASVWGASMVAGLIALAAPDGGVPEPRAPRGPQETTAMLVDAAANVWLSAVGHLTWLAGAAGPSAPSSSRSRDASDAAASPVVEQSMGRKDGMTGDLALALLQDREGNVWVGTEGGLDRFRATRLTPAPIPDLLGPALAAGDNGQVWIASVGSNPLLVGREVRRRADLPAEIECAYRDPDGGVWFGGEHGLWRVVNDHVVRVQKPDGFSGAFVQSMARQRDGTLWLSLVRAGVFRRIGDAAWSRVAALPEGGALPAITVVADDAGRTWLGYTQDRLARISAGDSVRLFTGADGLHVGNVTALHTRGSHVWVGGESGLALLDGDRLTPISATDSDALRGLSGIVETSDGELWVNGAAGVARLPASEVRRARADTGYRVRAERFDFRDGLSGVAPQIRPVPSAISDGSGVLWFATSSGVFSIDPRRVRRNRLAPPVTITALDASGITNPGGDSAALPQRTTALHFRYTALSLGVPDRVRFRYRLDGIDHDWQDAGARREAFYTNLGPGSYRFRVIAANDDGVWNETGATMRVVIAPTFMQTRAFLALCLVAAAGLIWLLLVWRQRRVTAALHSRFEVTLAERTRIAQELHDTLLQGFTGVTMQLYAVRALLRTRPGDAEATLAGALEYADSSLRDAREAVWELRSPALDTRGLPGALAEAVREAGASSTVEVRCMVRGNPRALPHATELTALRVGRECVVNAIKHADAHLVLIELAYAANVLTLRVEDDGKGFVVSDAMETRGGHWGIIGMRERASTVGGSLVVDSSPGRGTRVVLTLPVESVDDARDRYRNG